MGDVVIGLEMMEMNKACLYLWKEAGLSGARLEIIMIQAGEE